MSEPRTNHEDALQGALSEIISAQSALNMYPEPTPTTTGEPRYIPNIEVEQAFLSESDAWAKHSMEHLRAAFELVQRAWQERERLRLENMRLRLELLEHRKGSHP